MFAIFCHLVYMFVDKLNFQRPIYTSLVPQFTMKSSHVILLEGNLPEFVQTALRTISRTY